MAKFNKEAKAKIKPKIEMLFEEFNKVLRDNGLEEFSLKGLQISPINDVNLLDCPCGVERIIVGNRIIERCKRCPPPPPGG